MFPPNPCPSPYTSSPCWDQWWDRPWIWYLSLLSLTIPSSSLTCHTRDSTLSLASSLSLLAALRFFPISFQPDLLISYSQIPIFYHAYIRYNIASSRLEYVSLSLILILSISLVLSLRSLVKSLMSRRSLSYHYLVRSISYYISYLLNTYYTPSPISLSTKNFAYPFLLISWWPSGPLINDGFYLLNPHFFLLVLHKITYD